MVETFKKLELRHIQPDTRIIKRITPSQTIAKLIIPSTGEIAFLEEGWMLQSMLTFRFIFAGVHVSTIYEAGVRLSVYKLIILKGRAEWNTSTEKR